MKSSKLAPSIVLMVITLAMAAEANDFEFRPGQVVYIHAEIVCGPEDPAFESRLRSLFLERAVFYVTNEVTEADFVFTALFCGFIFC